MNNIGRKLSALLLALACGMGVAARVPLELSASQAPRSDVCASAVLYEAIAYEDVEAAFEEQADSDASCEAGVVVGSRILELFFGKEDDSEETSSRPSLIVGGGIFGTRIKEALVSVAAADEGGVLKEGDKIISIDNKDMHSIADIKHAVKTSEGREMNICCVRGGKRISVKCTPKEVGGEYKLGAVLREGAAGIGTVTYVNPKTGEFGGLGHGICDPENGEVIQMSGGNVTDVILGGVVKGEEGKPGELTGILTDRPLGEIYANTECGVFGRLDTLPKGCGSLTPIAYRSEVHEGDAKIISTLKNGATMEYSVRLSDVKSSSTGTKCFKVEVTDPALLAISGGIVRGMSGSPIIQDGKLVGAVTHVMVADPSSGYGIFIENMLEAAQQNTIPKAA